MFSTFFRFETRYWLRSMMLYVFIFVMAVFMFALIASDNVRISTVDNTNKNAPFVIQIFYGAIGIITTVMVAAFVATAGLRDFVNDTNQIVFTKPIRKFPYLMGRFWAATLIAMVPAIGLAIGSLIARWMPWMDAEDLGPVAWQTHLASFFMFTVPNTILVASVIFAIAVWTRSSVAAFIGAILIIVASSISSALVGNLDNDTFAALTDPFGMDAFGKVTRYWTAAEKDTQFVGLTGIYRVTEDSLQRLDRPSLRLDYWKNDPHALILINRALWTSVGMAVLGLALGVFSFADRKRRSKKQLQVTPSTATAVALPTVSFHHGLPSNLTRLLSQIKMDLWQILKSGIFIVLMFVAFLNTIVALILTAGEGFGLRSLPVTYQVISIIQGAMYIFLLATIVFFAGALVWKERDAKLDELHDALPQPTWIAYLAKLIALTIIVAIVLSVCVAAGMIVQASKGYTRFQPGLYFTELFAIDFVSFFCFIVLALLSHVLAPNKYAGYFLFVILMVINAFVWNMLEVQSNMLDYASLPGHVYSDMFLYAPFSQSINWFSAYWLLFAGLLSVGAILLWQRGKERGYATRMAIARSRWRGGVATTGVLLLVAFSGVAGWVYYNTKVLNDYDSADHTERMQAQYEVRFKQYEDAAQPRVTQVNYTIDIYPERRGLHLAGEQVIENKSEETIDRIFVNMPDEDFQPELTIEGTELEEDFTNYDFRIYTVSPPMQPGETRNMSYTLKYEPVGFENTVTNRQIVQNGTFFNNMIVPQIGYQTGAELTDKRDRKKHDLGPPQVMPPLDPENLKARRNTYLSNNSDLVDIETTISTSADQIAIAPGSLQKSWEEDGRRYFHYKIDYPCWNFYSFISARYEMAVRKWQDVDIEVYYHPEHVWNVENMLRSIRKSLEYYTENFGPYKHKQARIIEFPRIASFAQAFPGTMPYSEGIGFIADIEKEDDIDMVYYVVAHEMAHQWWAHQVLGANMQGATVLSETLAQYSALMVMEKEYGRDMMRKFLQYEMDRYLQSRGSEQLKEQPLAKVEAQQGYIHYRKGSVVMYYLKEMIGEEAVNKALKNLVNEFGYQGPPYPTSQDLIDALRKETPDEYQYLFADLFDNITLFANRTKKATMVEREDGKYDVTIEVECKKYQADDQGQETEVPVNDWIEIGALAKPEKGKRFGKTLYRERKKITEADNTFQFTVDEAPEEAGIDPFALLIDRMPDDNTKKVKLVSDP